MLERRQEPRASSVFKSAYVRTESGLQFVTLRNISGSGVCLDAFPGASVGDEIEFCIDATGPKVGTIRWVKDGLCGVVTSVSDNSEIAEQRFPPRSVRLPLSLEVKLFVDGNLKQATLHNISIRGACISSVSNLITGQLVSLEIAGFCLELASVRWVNHGLFGLRFAKPIHPAVFRDLVVKMQQVSGCGVSAHQDMNCAA